MIDLLARFEALARAMKADKRFTDVKFKLGKPLKPLDEQSLAASRIRLEPAVMDFYRAANGFAFSWRLGTTREEPFTSGEVCLPGFSQTFVHSWKGKLWFDDMADPEIETAQRFMQMSMNLAGFDVADATFDGTRMAVFPYDMKALREASTAWAAKQKKKKPAAAVTEPARGRKAQVEAKLHAIAQAVASQPAFEPGRLWFWNLKGNKFPLVLGLEAYLTQALLTRGLTDWQTFFVDLDALDFGDPLTLAHLVPHLYTEPPKLRIALGWLTTLFPDVDAAPFAERLAKFESRVAELPASRSSSS